MRKFVIGIISLVGVLAIYLLYTGVSNSPIFLDDPGKMPQVPAVKVPPGSPIGLE